MANPILVYKTKSYLSKEQRDRIAGILEGKCVGWDVLVVDCMDSNDVVGLMPEGVTAVAHGEAYKMLFEQAQAASEQQTPGGIES